MFSASFFLVENLWDFLWRKGEVFRSKGESGALGFLVWKGEIDRGVWFLGRRREIWLLFLFLDPPKNEAKGWLL